MEKKLILWGISDLAHQAYPEETENISDHFVLQSFLAVVHNSPVKSDIKKTLEDKNITVEKTLEKNVTSGSREENSGKVTIVSNCCH